MPIINEDEDLTKNKETPVGGGTSYIGGGASGAGASSGSTAAPISQTSNGPGTGFNNIQNYLGNSDGGARMASGIANKANELGGAANTAINTFSSDAQNAATAGIPEQDSRAPAAPTYAGPSAYNEGTLADSFGNAQKGATAVNSWLNPTNPDGTTKTSALGVQTQLRNLNGGGRYTQGENALDSAITRSGTGSGVLNNMQNKWGGIGNYLDSAKTGATNAIGAAKAKSQGVQDQWNIDRWYEANKAAPVAPTATVEAPAAPTGPTSKWDNSRWAVAAPAPEPIPQPKTNGKSDIPGGADAVMNTTMDWIMPDVGNGSLVPRNFTHTQDGTNDFTKVSNQVGNVIRKVDPVYSGYKTISKWIR